VNSLPILYSFRRCPYAIRARMAIRYADIKIEIREVLLSDKPQSMLAVSPKGTVPVLLLADGTIMDESIDIMSWALQINDPEQWRFDNDDMTARHLLEQNDGSFKINLDYYKYADRFPEHSMQTYRQRGEEFLSLLETCLSKHAYLTSECMSQIDVAIFPFIRQFAFVDKDWFDQSSYVELQRWLTKMLALDVFTSVMKKYQQWEQNSSVEIF